MTSLPVPRFGTDCLSDLLPSVLGALGAAPRGPLPLDPADHVCVLLVDGLGWNALQDHRADAPFLASLLDAPGSRAITTVFPSTTPIALTSLGTGLAPGQHGITGLLLRLDDGRVVNTLAFPDEVDGRALQPVPTAFEQAAAAGVEVTRVGPGAFAANGLTMAGLRGGTYAAGETLGERVAQAVAAAGRGTRTMTYVYVGDLDATGHRHGCGSPPWRQELVHLDRLIEQLAGALPPGVTLLVTSDHGMVLQDPALQRDLALEPELDAGVESLTGDPRGAFVHARPGATADVLAAWTDLLGSDFWVLAVEQAEALGLFGEVADHVRPRLGDVVVAARGGATVLDSRTAPAVLLTLVGGHGSVTADELLVPLLTYRR